MPAPQVPQITTPAPNRNDPENFSPRMDTFLGEFPDVIDGINTVADYVETTAGEASDSATAAATSASDADDFRASAQVAAVNSDLARAESQDIKDSNEVIAAAVQSAAGLPSLVGQAGRVLKVNATEDGVEWGVGIEDEYTVITASGDFSKSPNATWIQVECIGGGASGRNNASTTSSGGGGGGQSVRQLFRASDVSSPISVVIGAGGAAIANGVAADGNVGGNTTFGALLTAKGGFGGTSSSAGNPGGAGGALADATTTNSIPYQFGSAAGFSNTAGRPTVYGGAGGGGSGNTTQGAGGASQYGGSGAGARGEVRVWQW